MLSKTSLHDAHRAMGGKMVDFGGWSMPLHYGSQIKEHLQVRSHSGMFDVSHMTVVDVAGGDATAFLRCLLANDVAKLKSPNRAMYSVMLNDAGGVVDDLIVYFRAENHYRLVVNCATRDKDLAWLDSLSQNFDIEISERPDLGIIAVQGPRAQQIFSASYAHLALEKIPYFGFAEAGDWMVAATGYTGEEGFEVILPNSELGSLWAKLHQSGVQPIGLGARDSLRLEAGYCLYGNEMDEQVSPWSANLGWTISLDDDARDFLGRSAIESARENSTLPKLVGLVMEDKGVLRAGQSVLGEHGETGAITSGGFSPSLEKSIALARVPMSVSGHCEVLVRDKKKRVRVVSPCFVRQGKILI